MKLLTIYILTIILSLILHFSVGYMIKRRFKVLNKYQDLKTFQELFREKQGRIKRWSRYIVFFIPILNLFIAMVEVSHKDKSIRMILKEIEKMHYSKVIHQLSEERKIPHREQIDFSKEYQGGIV